MLAALDLDPWEENADWRAAMQANVTANAAGADTKIRDFLRVPPPLILIPYAEGVAEHAAVFRAAGRLAK